MADPRLKRLAQLKALALNNPSEEEARSAAVAALKLEKEIAGEQPKPRTSDGPMSQADVDQMAERMRRRQEARARQAEEQYRPPRQGPTYRQSSDFGGGYAQEPTQKEKAERLVAEREKRISAEVSARLTQAVNNMQRQFDQSLHAAHEYSRRQENQGWALKDKCKALQSRIEELEALLHESRALTAALTEDPEPPEPTLD